MERGRPPLVCARRGLVAALQNSVMQVRCVCSPRIEADPNTFGYRIGLHFFYAWDSLQRLAKPPDAFVAVVPLGRNFDRFEHFVISGIVEIVRIGGVHALISRIGREVSAFQSEEMTKRLPSLSLNMA